MPGLDRLGELLEQVRAAGLPVELSVEGERRPLDAGIELSAYRIIQEALTNVLKHARGARARVDAALPAAEPGDRGRRRGWRGRRGVGDPATSGRGLIGMRERVAVFGGRLEAGPDADRVRVSASLPDRARPAVGRRMTDPRPARRRPAAGPDRVPDDPR